MSSRRKSGRSRSRTRASVAPDASGGFTWEALKAETLRLVVRDLKVPTRVAPRTRDTMIDFVQSVQAHGLTAALAQLRNGKAVASSAAGSGFPFPWDELATATLRALLEDIGAPENVMLRGRDMIDFMTAAEAGHALPGTQASEEETKPSTSNKSSASNAPRRPGRPRKRPATPEIASPRPSQGRSRKRSATPEIETSFSHPPSPKRGRKVSRSTASSSTLQVSDPADEKPKAKRPKLRARTRSLSRSGANVLEVDLSIEDVAELLAQEPPSAQLHVVSLQPRKLDDGAVYTLLAANIHRVRSIAAVDMSAVVADVLEAYVAPVLEELRMAGEDVFPLSTFEPEAPRLKRLYLSTVDQLALPDELWAPVSVFSVEAVQHKISAEGVLRVVTALAENIEILRLPCALSAAVPAGLPPSVLLSHLEDLALAGPAAHCAYVLTALEFGPFVNVLLNASYSDGYSPRDLDLDRRIGLVDLVWSNTISAAPTRTMAVSYTAPGHLLGGFNPRAQLCVHSWLHETVVDGVPDFRISQNHPASVRADVTGLYDLGHDAVPQYAVYVLLLPALALETVCILSLRLEPNVKGFGLQKEPPHPGNARWGAQLWSVPLSQARQLSHLRVVAPGAEQPTIMLVDALADNSEEVEPGSKRQPLSFLLPALRTLTLACVAATSTCVVEDEFPRTVVQAVRELIQARAREGLPVRVFITSVDDQDRRRWEAGLAAVSDFVKFS